MSSMISVLEARTRRVCVAAGASLAPEAEVLPLDFEKPKPQISL